MARGTESGNGEDKVEKNSLDERKRILKKRQVVAAG